MAEPIVETPVEKVETPAPMSIPDDALVEVLVDGKPVVQPWKEARAGIQMQADYTRKSQAVAKQATELRELFDGLTAREKAIVEKETAIDSILGRTKPGQKDGQSTLADDDVPTVAQIKQLLKEHTEGLTKQVDSKLTEQRTADEQTKTFQRWEDLTQTTVESLTKEYPLLSNVPQLDVVLKREALKDKPQSEKEMTTAIYQAGKRLNESLDKAFVERKKAEAIRKQELTAKGSQPPGGVPSFKAPTKTYGERARVNWDEIERDAIAAVEAAEE